jgi:hypothetical protein
VSNLNPRKSYALSDESLTFGPVHRAECEDCRWVVEKKSRAAVRRAGAAHIEATGHLCVVVESRRLERFIACPLLPKYESHPNRVPPCH